ncbi:MAG: SIS domain-containing protein [Thermoplasmata archaeon]
MAPRKSPLATPLPTPDDPHPPYGRTAHPFFMHDMIRSQPDALRRTAESALDASEEIRRPPAGRPLLFVGQGTSFHAALGAATAARYLLGPHALIRAVPSFDLLLDPDLIRAARCAVIFSASGETALTLRAQEALAKAKVRQVLITGTPHSPSARLADHTLVTQGADERAWTHTVSFTAALTAAYALLSVWSGREEESVRALHRSSASALAAEPSWKRLAESLRDRRRWLLLGSGPAEVTAREAALKLREGAGRFVAWCGVEEFLHGILPSIDDSAVVLAVATGPLDLERARHAVHAAELAGAKAALLGRLEGTRTVGEFPLPEVLPAFSPAIDVLPFQLMTYWTAVAEGRNPDVMGYDNPKVWAARRSFGI